MRVTALFFGHFKLFVADICGTSAPPWNINLDPMIRGLLSSAAMIPQLKAQVRCGFDISSIGEEILTPAAASC